MTTALQVTITVDETRLSPARLVADLTRGFLTYRDQVYRLPETALDLKIETLTVRPVRRRAGSVSPTRSPGTDRRGGGLNGTRL
jgi:hypothetical protein